MDEAFDLKFLFGVLKKYIVLIAVAAVICGAVGYSCASFLIAPKYESDAMLYVENSQVQSDKVNSSDLNAAQQLVNTCQILFKSNSMMDKLIAALDLPYTKAQLGDMISAQAVNSTEVMKLSVTCADAKEASEIVNKLVELSITEFGRVIKTGSIEVISYGEVNLKPVSPSVPKYTAIGLFIGLVVCYGIVFLKEMFDVAVKRDDDLGKIYDIPVFAEIDDFERKSTGKYGYGSYGYGGSASYSENTKGAKETTNRHFLGENTPFSIAEAYKTARTNIMFAVAPSSKKIIVVTSANPGEGKSTTCSNIAIAFANAGNKVLLIDCDLRKPTMKNGFGIVNSNGLSTVLGGFCELSEAVNTDVCENLDVITAGAIPPNPSELIGSDIMKALLESACEQYNYIFLDTPPVSVVTDSQLFNEQAAGLVFVVKENSTTHPDIQNALDKITVAKGKMLGFVKTFCVSGKSRRYSKYSGGYEYRYGGTEKEKNTVANG